MNNTLNQSIYTSEKILPYVYMCTNRSTKQFYIGSRTSKKLKYPSHIDLPKYKTSSKYVKPNFNEYDWFIIAEFFDSKDAYLFEQETIKELWNNPLILNKHYTITGQIYNPGQSKTSREKASLRMKSDSNPAKHQSTETRAKIKDTITKYIASFSEEERSKKYGSFGKDNPQFNKSHSLETVSIISKNVSDSMKKIQFIWMHNILGKNIRVPKDLINEAIGQGCLKGYAPGTHPNLKRGKGFKKRGINPS